MRLHAMRWHAPLCLAIALTTIACTDLTPLAPRDGGPSGRDALHPANATYGTTPAGGQAVGDAAGPTLDLAVSPAAGATLTNGIIDLGVHRFGNLSDPTNLDPKNLMWRMLRYRPTDYDALDIGCPCEGWGVADAASGTFGYANQYYGYSGVVSERFETGSNEVRSVVSAAGGRLRVTHHFRPTVSAFLYEGEVTIENLGPAVADVRYTRAMDWDMNGDFVTVHGAAGHPLVRYASNNPFQIPNPLASRTAWYGPMTHREGDFTDIGPADIGAIIDLALGPVAPGAGTTFYIYYGAAGTEADALAALASVGAEVYSLGQPNYRYDVPAYGPVTGQPNTFIFGFRSRTNRPPIASISGPAEGVEGPDSLTFDGTASSDPDGDAITHAWTISDQAGEVIESRSGSHATIAFPENGTYTVRLVVTDEAGLESVAATKFVTVTNAAPVPGGIIVPLEPVAHPTAAVVSAAFTDRGVNDTHTGEVQWTAGGAWEPAIVTPGAPGTGTVSASSTLPPGIYTVSLRVTDDDGGTATGVATSYVVVYDPAAGDVSGSGWFTSTAAADCPTFCTAGATGRAQFGFTSKYVAGRSAPIGTTRFRFRDGGLSFASDSYQTLVVAGNRAQFWGYGEVNGRSGFAFRVTAVDGDVAGIDGTADRFRVEIWDGGTFQANQPAGGMKIYDNQWGDPQDAALRTAIEGGKISIRK